MKKKDIKYIIIFLIPIIVFSTALAIYFPGILTYDSFNQLNQIKDMNYTNAHPFIHTFIEMMALKVWNNPASIAVLQIIVFSITWTWACYITKNEKTSNYVLQLVLTILISILPLNFITTITLWKDILYAQSILIVTVLLYIWIKQNYSLSLPMILALAASIISVMYIRHNGKYVGIVLAIIVFGIIIIKNRKELKNSDVLKRIIAFPCILIVLFLAFKIPYKLYNVEDVALTVTPKLTQVIGAFSSHDALDESDKAELSEYIDLEKLNEVYTPYFVDIVDRAVINGAKANENQTDMIKIILKNSIKHPIVAIKYGLESTSIMWRIDKPAKAENKIYGTVIALEDYKDNIINYDHIGFANSDTKIFNKINNIITYTIINKGVRTALYSHGIALYLQIIIIIVLVLNKKEKSYFLIIIPNILNLLSLMLSIPVQDVRYVYATYLVEYFTILVLIKELTDNPEKIKAFFSRNKQNANEKKNI